MRLFFAACLLIISGEFEHTSHVRFSASQDTVVTSIVVAVNNVQSSVQALDKMWSDNVLNLTGSLPLLFTNFVASTSIIYKPW